MTPGTVTVGAAATRLDGKALALRLEDGLRERVARLPRTPGLAVVLVGADPASQVYVRHKGKAAERVGLVHRQIDLPAHASRQEILDTVAALNADPAIDGILVQLPLPRREDELAVIDAIAPHKDVDGFSVASSGLLSQGRASLVPCTPKGVMRLLAEAGVRLAGAHAVVIGRSNIVGRPMAQLLEQANATVTLCHSRTADLAAHCRRADVIVAAVGRAELVRGDWVKPGAVVIDVGMNRLPPEGDAKGRLVGDVAYDEVAAVASAVTPVPGGVGPMTIAMLLDNTVTACEMAHGVARG